MTFVVLGDDHTPLRVPDPLRLLGPFGQGCGLVGVAPGLGEEGG